MIQLEIKVAGRVHGVGFRYFAVQKAGELGVTGWVKNRVDGSLLIIAQGDEPVLNTFVDFLRIGPTRARIDKIMTYKMELLNDFNNFSVKY